MRNIFILVVVFGISLGGHNAFSQEKPVRSPLTLEECIRLALRNRPELEMAKLDVGNAEQQIKEANSYYYPRLNFTGGYTRFNLEKIDFLTDITAIKDKLGPFASQLPNQIVLPVEAGKTNWSYLQLDLNQPIYTFGRIQEAVEQARIGYSITLNQQEKKRREIILEVKKGYYQFLLAKEIHHLMQEADARANVVGRMVKIAYETSIPGKEEKGTTRLDYLKARNFHSEMRARLSEASKNLKLAELALKMAVGVDPDEVFSVVEIPFDSMARTPFNSVAIKEKLQEKNIDLKNLNLGVQLFDAKRRAARKEYLPKIGLQGQYVGPRDRYGIDNFWYLGIGLTMPLFDGFSTQAKIGQAEAQFQKTKGQKLLLEKALTIQIDHLHTTLMELRERIEILQTAIQETRERTQLASDGYAAGITEYDELLLAQRTELEMKAAYLQGLHLYQATISEMEFISGDI
jgi:outer membrane protein TolC